MELLNNAADPIVTVVVPVYNAMPYLMTCLASVLEQSIGLGGIEVVAVDDGSTDGSGGQLDLLAACWNGLRVVHHDRSGGPSRPRNTGLDMATGRYVFFLDADDYLATQALERMLALAEEDGSDVVVCDRKEIGGSKLHVREGAKSRRNGKDTTVFKSWNNGPMCAYDMSMVAGSDCKHLYRRDRIERLSLRFPEGINFGEDSMFATSYAEGAKISAVEDYCCYYERFRPDGSNLTTWLAGSEMHLDALERAWRLKADHQPRWMRDLLPREIILDLNLLVFNERFARHDGEVRRRLVARAQALLATLPMRGVAARMSALDRLKLDLIGRAMEPELVELTRAMAQGQRGKDVIIGGRVYGAYPFFRDPAVGVPDECYDVTAELGVRQHLACLSLDGSTLRMVGHAYIDHVDAVEAGTAVVLRERAGGGEHRMPVQQVPVTGLAGEGGGGWYDYRLAGFDIELDLSNIAGSSLSPGQWGVFLAVSAQGVSKEVPLGRHRAIAVDASVQSPGTGRFSAYFAKHGTLTLDVRAEPGESR